MDDKILSPLNDKQREAVVTTDGALLVLAGAGSGKTRVITHRFAYLLREKKIRPYNILSVTFTNKAANEMKERISKLVGYDLSNVWIRTFHSTGLMILRQNAELLDYPKDFVVYDDTDSKALITNILKELNYSKDRFNPSAILNKISSLKDDNIGVDEFRKNVYSSFDDVVVKVYEEYEKRLKKNKAFDFSDLIIVPYKLLKENEKVLIKYRELWNYIMIDEFQDTNVAQYEFVKLIAGTDPNICVVGDDDQSIYSWRGARVRNIYDFKEKYNAKVIPLEQNYRSTSIILEAANMVVEKIFDRMEKKLWTDNKGGEKIKVFEAFTDKEEAKWVIDTIDNLLVKYDYKDFAIFYRTNAQSRIFEEELLYRNIPYKVFGGQKFYSRKEIKDILAYIKFIINPDDWVSFERIIDIPKRGVGEATLTKIRRLYDEGFSLLDILTGKYELDRVNKNVLDSLKDLGEIVKELTSYKESISPANFVKILLDTIDYKSYLIKTEENGEERWENVEELINSITVYEGTKKEATIVDYISDITLQSSSDEIGNDEERNYVSLMTIHNAKGLEFPVVFIVGTVEGLIPHSSATESVEEMNEERRLFYVAITRAKERLYISYSQTRMNYGEVRECNPSSFLKDISKDELVEHISSRGSYKNNKNVYKEDVKKIPKNMNSIESYNELTTGTKIYHSSFGEGEVKFVSENIIKVNFSDFGIQMLAKNEISKIKVIR